MERIETTNLEFVKIEPRGNAIKDKYWVKHNGINKLVKPSSPKVDQDLIETISSEILNKINIDCVQVELGYDSILKSNCCLVSSYLVDDADVSYEMLTWKNVKSIDEAFAQIFNKYSNLYEVTETEIEHLRSSFIRVMLGKCITENMDSKLSNIGLIYNERLNQYRLPPSYDNGMSFRSYNSFSKPVCFVGNQLFYMAEVVDYIITNYFDYVSDVIPLLDNLINDLELLVEKYPIEQEKKDYIVRYVCDINNTIQNKIKEKTK